MTLNPTVRFIQRKDLNGILKLLQDEFDNEEAQEIIYHVVMYILRCNIIRKALKKTNELKTAHCTRFRSVSWIREIMKNLVKYPIVDGNVLHFSDACCCKFPQVSRCFSTTGCYHPSQLLVAHRINTPIIKLDIKRRPSQCYAAKTQAKRLEILLPLHFSKASLSRPTVSVPLHLVVVGASSAGLSLISTLLEHPTLNFDFLTLIDAQGNNVEEKGCNYNNGLPKPGTQSPLLLTLRRYCIFKRVRLLRSRVRLINRAEKYVGTEIGERIYYDYLFLTTGAQDNTLERLHLRSFSLPALKSDLRTLNGVLSISDPNVDSILDYSSPLVKTLRWNPLAFALIYGRSINAFSMVQALLSKNIGAEKIFLICPPE
ncbi:hypothetical protein IE077_003620 [Cardiosporidium cionae]|uniref:Uncharacterized protein n=1 Tax=Cardiosporidium cionae TaxID=476202 RepID=A0ABQ7J7V6_9APIC|nr:hypothetical protein IE077_003620 [Cardiosporidium cionae]|eukprot:KAF8820070.1 hypothetical protein IE077_003620 [Cardiosporidium cionae]